ncbi:MAG: DUF2169 domain-containing protein [Burkholderiaceae bacterium]|nr:DUF2169 domain-containing protein [Burkholderiaceae bacterium]
MRVIKPQHLALMHRCLEREQRAWLCVSTMAFIALDQNNALLSEQEFWSFINPLLGETPIDIAVPKTGGEYLLTGNAIAPGGKPVDALQVQTKLGKLEKTINVFGKRIWIKNKPSKPESFTQLSLDWSNAYGGAAFPENPQGIGYKPQQTPAGPLHFLPHLEHPKYPSSKSGSKIPPISFGALKPTSAARQHFDGSYTKDWLEQQFPGPPLDLNWRYFCCASQDQWQPEPFVGNEAFELIHMHADQPKIKGALPGIRAVVALQRTDRSSNTLQLLDPKLSTVWFFPNQLRMVLIWHAITPLEDEFADKIKHIAIAAEWLDKPKGAPHYLQAIKERLDPEKGVLRMLDDEDFLPQGMATPNELLKKFENLLGSSGIALENHQTQLAARQAALRQDLTERFPEATLKAVEAEQKAILSHLPDISEKLPKKTDELLKMGKQLFNKLPSEQQVTELMKTQKASHLAYATRQLEAIGGDLSLLKPFGNSPASTTSIKPLSATLAEMQLNLLKLPQKTSVETVAPTLLKQAMDDDKKISALLRSASHHQPAPDPLSCAEAIKLRKSASSTHAQGMRLSGKSMRAATFAGMDLSGADFSDSDLTGADFTEAKLHNACFDRANLAYAIFMQAQLIGASFQEANLSKSNFSDADASNCDFSNATIMQTRFERSNLRASQLTGNVLTEVNLQSAQCQRLKLNDATVLRSQLSKVDFSNAELSKTSFVECSMEHARFCAALLSKANFVTCSLTGSNFDNSEAENLRFVHGSVLQSTSFRKAHLYRSSFRAMALQQSNFSEALLDGSDFSKAQCAGTDFSFASMKETLLLQANLKGACLRYANLMQSILQHSRLLGADLYGANLFAADMARIEKDSDTVLEKTYMAKVRHMPVKKVLPPLVQI